MNIKIIKKKNYNKIIIILTIILITLYQTNFFKKLYFTLSRSHETRLIKEYQFCGSESIGFLSSIKNQFNIDYKIPIINYETSPNSSWYFNELKKIKTNKVIFLNYRTDNKNFDYKENNKFSHRLNSYKILYKYNNCYFLQIND
jgi:hypothetical protein|tara:strand:- start:96 stop:527 length:432 start_codon:yes stop_codon:yes gene_type:complete